MASAERKSDTINIIECDNYNNITKLLIDNIIDNATEFVKLRFPIGKTVLDCSQIKNIDIISQEWGQEYPKLNIHKVVNNFMYEKNLVIKKLIALNTLNGKPEITPLAHTLVYLYGKNMIKNSATNYNLKYVNNNGLSRSNRIVYGEYVLLSQKNCIIQLSNNMGYGAMPCVISCIKGGGTFDINNVGDLTEIGKQLRECEPSINCQNIINHNIFYAMNAQQSFNAVPVSMGMNDKLVIGAGSIIQGIIGSMLHSHFY